MNAERFGFYFAKTVVSTGLAFTAVCSALAAYEATSVVMIMGLTCSAVIQVSFLRLVITQVTNPPAGEDDEAEDGRQGSE